MKKYHHFVKFTYPLSFQTRIPKVDNSDGFCNFTNMEPRKNMAKYLSSDMTSNVSSRLKVFQIWVVTIAWISIIVCEFLFVINTLWFR